MALQHSCKKQRERKKRSALDTHRVREAEDFALLNVVVASGKAWCFPWSDRSLTGQFLTEP